MAKKIFIVGFAMIILCLCCGICFAAEDNSVGLGNEVMQSIDKSGKSINNVVSGNWTNDDGKTKDTKNDLRDDAAAITGNTGNNGDAGNYNTTKTTVEGMTNNAMSGTMSSTTWMWIILVVAAIIIIAAIWYYATQSND